MRTTYVNHACLMIEAGSRKIVTDPWFAGPAYADQWHPFPKPVNAALADEADVLLISHGHEDHLHEPTMRSLDRKKRVFYPFNWYGGTVDWIRSMGYTDVTEAASCRTYDLGGGAKVTFIVNGHDSIMVVEEGDTVLVNVNDALHSSEPHVIDTYADYIRQRWPRIETVFCGFGGASYYPNTFHGPGKDDRAVALLREQLFAHNFCRIVSRLHPAIAVPFAADFALLAAEQRWINEARFPREDLPRYFREQGGKSSVQIMYSGDRLTQGKLEPHSPLRERLERGEGEALLDEQYPRIVSALAAEASVGAERLSALRGKLEANAAEQSTFYDPAKVSGLRFAVHLRDALDISWLNVSVEPGLAEVTCAEEPAAGAVAHVDTTADVLDRSLESDWGGDAIIIGYGCAVRVQRAEDLRNGRGRICAELCVRHPRPKAYAAKHPLRVARFLAQTPFAFRSKLERKLSGAGGSTNVVNGTHWLAGTPEEIRRVCGLPEYQLTAMGQAA